MRQRSARLKWNRLGDFLEIRRNRAGARNHVEQDVPLRAEQHQQYRADAESAAQLDDGQQQDRKQRRRGNRSRDLRNRLQEPGEPRIEIRWRRRPGWSMRKRSAGKR